MTQRRILLFTLFMTLVFNAAYGGIELRSKQMRTSDGLPNNSVRYLYQDSKGFLWLATLNGLSRYDGNSFLTFRPEIGDKVSFGFMTLPKTKMVFYGSLQLRNCSVVMICNVPVL